MKKHKNIIAIGIVFLCIACAVLVIAQDSPAPIKMEEITPSEDYQFLEGVEINGKVYIGNISIPKYNIDLPVLSESTPDNLDLAACRMTGSPHTDDLIICAHNYKNWFWNLHNMENGDKVIFTDIYQQEYHYEVIKTEKIHKTEIDNMLNGDWDLTLFTCAVDRVNRVTVRCMEV